MEIFFFLIGFLFLIYDISLLKRRSYELYLKIFRIPAWELGVWVFFLAAAVLSIWFEKPHVPGIVAFGWGMIYFVRRQQFMVMTRDAPGPGALDGIPKEEKDEHLELALSTVPIIGIWAALMIVVSLVVEGFFSLMPSGLDELTRVILLSEVSVVILLVLIYRSARRCQGLKLMQVLGLETKGLGGIKLWVFPAFFALFYALTTSLVLESRPIQPMTPLQELMNSTTSVGVLIFFVATAILTAPFFEEVIFRGYFFYVIRPYKGVVFAVIFVALVFGVLHMDQYWGDWGAIFVVGLLGLTLTLFRAWTGSSVPGMVAHYVYNASLVIIPVVTVVVANPVYFDYQINYYRLNNEEKEERLLASINQNPRFGGPYNDLAWHYSEQEIKLEKGLELIDFALSLEPENYAFWDTKAEVLFKMKRIGEAVAIAQRLVDKYPNDRYLREQLQKFQSAFSKEIDI